MLLVCVLRTPGYASLTLTDRVMTNPNGAMTTLRRTEILGTARGLFARQGISNTSIRDIATASGMLPGSLYSHFASKAEIVERAIQPFYDRILAEQEAVLAAAPDGHAAMSAMVRAVFPILLEHAEATLILHYSWPELSEHGALDPIVAQGLEVLENWLTAARLGEQDGTLASPLPAPSLVRIINSAMFSLLDRHRYETLDGGAVPLDVEATVDGLVELLVRPAQGTQ